MENGEVKVDNTKKIKLGYIISTIIIIIGCFMPYMSSYGVSVNYINSGDQVNDGVLVIGAFIIACIFLLCNKKIPVIIFQLIAIAIFAYDYINLQSELSQMSFFADLIKLDVGFYVILIGMIISVISGILLIKHKNNK